MQRFYVAALLTLSAAALVVAPAPAARAQAGCPRPPEPAEPIAEVPWAQHWFAPDRIWPLSQGDGVVVAVVDTGVDAGHPQLRGATVRAGLDLLPEPVDARLDCHSHGTAVASIVAATQVDGVGFAGLAPGAEILPVRVAEDGVETASDSQREPPVTPERFAEAVAWASAQGAEVINLSIVFYQDHPPIAEAVATALERGAVVVAAVGNEQAAPAEHPTPYPAAYPGVIGVGALTPEGGVTPEAYAGVHLDLLAPGAAVTAAAAAGGHRQWDGSSFAAPFVSAAAALLRAAEPELTAAEATERLYATADPGPGSAAGVLNPYRALTERVVDGAPVTAPPPPEPAVDPAAELRAQRWHWARSLAILIAVSSIVLVAALAGGAVVWRKGRRRGWRPTRHPAPAPAEHSDRAPEQEFFRVPTPRDRH